MRRLSLIVAVLFALLLSAVAVYAQEATAEAPASEAAAPTNADGDLSETDESANAAEEVPQGVSTLVLLLGAGAIFLVGLLRGVRDTRRPDDEEAA